MSGSNNEFSNNGSTSSNASNPNSAYSSSSILNGGNGTGLPNNGNFGSLQINQLWMGDLDPWWDETAIKQIWASVGETSSLLQVKLIYNRNIQANQTGNSANSGYCFLTFNSPQLTQQALSRNGTVIPGTNKLFKLNWASAGQQQQQQQAQSLSLSHNHNQALQHNHHQSMSSPPVQEFSIFVGDLLPDVTDKLLFEFFQSQYPSCSSAKIMMDQVTGNSRGYGFVKFTNELEQNKALLEMQSAILNGRPIRVSTATKNSQSHNRAGSGNQLSHPHQSALLQQQQQQSKVIIPPQYNPQLSPFTDSNNTTVFIGGLNVPISAEELRSYFQTYGDIVYAKVLDGKNCGFVQYVNRSDAERAMTEMQGFPVGTSRLRLAWGQKYSQHQQQVHPQQLQQSAQLQQSSQLQQQQQQSLYSSLMNHSMNGASTTPISNGYIDQNTYMGHTTPMSLAGGAGITNYNFDRRDGGAESGYIPQNLLGNDEIPATAFTNGDYFNLKDMVLNQLNTFR